MNDPRLIVHEGSASEIEAALRQHQLPAPDVIISGIPFSTMTRSVGEQILRSVYDALHSGGLFVAYQVRDRVESLGRRVFGRAQVQTEILNMPPMRVYRWQKGHRRADFQPEPRLPIRRACAEARAPRDPRRAALPRTTAPGPKRSRSASSARFKRSRRTTVSGGPKSESCASAAGTRLVAPTPSSRTGSRSPARASSRRATSRDRGAVVGGGRERLAPRQDRIAARSRRAAAPELELEHDGARAQRVAAQAPRDGLRVGAQRALEHLALGDVLGEGVLLAVRHRLAPGLDLAQILAAREPRHREAPGAEQRLELRRLRCRELADRCAGRPPRAAPAPTGPTPQMRPTGSGARNSRTASGGTSSRPSGLATSLAIFATSFTGAMPTEHGEPALALHLRAQPLARARAAARTGARCR